MTIEVLTPVIPLIEFTSFPLQKGVLTALQKAEILPSSELKLTEFTSSYKDVKKLLESLNGRLCRTSTFRFPYEPQPVIDLLLAKQHWPKRNPGAFFKTPSDIADQIVCWLDLPVDDTGAWVSSGRPTCFFDPSAGDGALLDAALRAYPKAVTRGVELDRFNWSVMAQQGRHRVELGDFLLQDIDFEFDCLLMNPPFKGATWIKHVSKAIKLLRPKAYFAVIHPSEGLHSNSRAARELLNFFAANTDGSLEFFNKEESGFPIDVDVIYGRRLTRSEIDEDWQPFGGYPSLHCYRAMARLDNDHEFYRLSKPAKIRHLDETVHRLQKQGDPVLWNGKVRQQVLAEMNLI